MGARFLRYVSIALVAVVLLSPKVASAQVTYTQPCTQAGAFTETWLTEIKNFITTNASAPQTDIAGSGVKAFLGYDGNNTIRLFVAPSTATLTYTYLNVSNQSRLTASGTGTIYSIHLNTSGAVQAGSLGTTTNLSITNMATVNALFSQVCAYTSNVSFIRSSGNESTVFQNIFPATTETSKFQAGTFEEIETPVTPVTVTERDGRLIGIIAAIFVGFLIVNAFKYRGAVE